MFWEQVPTFVGGAFVGDFVNLECCTLLTSRGSMLHQIMVQVSVCIWSLNPPVFPTEVSNSHYIAPEQPDFQLNEKYFLMIAH